MALDSNALEEVEEALNEAHSNEQHAVPIAIGGQPDGDRRQLRLEGVDGYGGYGGVNGLKQAFVALLERSRGRKFGSYEFAALLRTGKGQSHDTTRKGPGSQTFHCDVVGAVNDAVGGMSVCFVTGHQSSHIWVTEDCGAEQRRMIYLPPKTATIAPGSTGVHAGGTFKSDNAILHTYQRAGRALVSTLVST